MLYIINFIFLGDIVEAVEYSVKDLGKHNHKLTYFKVKFNKGQNTLSSLSMSVPTTAKKDEVIMQNLNKLFDESITKEKLVSTIEDEIAGLDNYTRVAKTAAIVATKLHAEQSAFANSKKGLYKIESLNQISKITISQRDTFKSYVMSEINQLEKPLKVIATKLSSDENLKSLSRTQLITMMAAQLMDFIETVAVEPETQAVCSDCDSAANSECLICKHIYCSNHLQTTDHNCSSQPGHSLSRKKEANTIITKDVRAPPGYLKKIKSDCCFVGCSQHRNIICCKVCASSYCKTHLASTNHMAKCGNVKSKKNGRFAGLCKKEGCNYRQVVECNKCQDKYCKKCVDPTVHNCDKNLNDEIFGKDSDDDASDVPIDDLFGDDEINEKMAATGNSTTIEVIPSPRTTVVSASTLSKSPAAKATAFSVAEVLNAQTNSTKDITQSPKQIVIKNGAIGRIPMPAEYSYSSNESEVEAPKRVRRQLLFARFMKPTTRLPIFRDETDPIFISLKAEKCTEWEILKDVNSEGFQVSRREHISNSEVYFKFVIPQTALRLDTNITCKEYESHADIEVFHVKESEYAGRLLEMMCVYYQIRGFDFMKFVPSYYGKNKKTDEESKTVAYFELLASKTYRYENVKCTKIKNDYVFKLRH